MERSKYDEWYKSIRLLPIRTKYRLFENDFMNKLAIIIPTLKYTKYLDFAIESALNTEHVMATVYVNINTLDSKEFKKSKFIDDKRVKWSIVDKYLEKMADSVNDAINRTKEDWLFILSDDDIVCNNFLKDVNLEEMKKNDLYATRIGIVDENNKLLRKNSPYMKKTISQKEAMEMFFNEKWHNHLSLFVFNRYMFEQFGPYSCELGYPNGYYIDTVFHGKMLSAVNDIYLSEEIVFLRRESSCQGSAKFYINSRINDYFKLIVNNLFEVDSFKRYAIIKYKTKQNYYKNMIYKRYFTVYRKLGNAIYGDNKILRFKLIYYAIVKWNTGLANKIKILLSLVYLPIKRIIPKHIDNLISRVK